MSRTERVPVPWLSLGVLSCATGLICVARGLNPRYTAACGATGAVCALVRVWRVLSKRSSRVADVKYEPRADGGSSCRRTTPGP